MDRKKIKRYVGIITTCCFLAAFIPASVVREAPAAGPAGTIAEDSNPTVGRGAGTIGSHAAISAAAAAAVAASQDDLIRQQAAGTRQ